MAGTGGPLADHLAHDDIPPDRGDCRGADHLVARTPRWRAQLGLPLLLDPRRDPDPLRAAIVRLSRRSARVARMAVAGGCRTPGRNADYVRPGRRAATDRV